MDSFFLKNEVFRWREYGVLLYRIGLVYVFFSLSRLFFIFFNKDAFGELTNSLIFSLLKYGLRFDTTAILYVNLLFILLSILPLTINRTERFQKGLCWIYFLTNGIALGLNFIDVLYYPFSKSRLTTASFAVIENEENKFSLLLLFLKEYWYVFLLFLGIILIWFFSYKRISLSTTKENYGWKYYLTSFISLIIIGIVVLAGLRGGDLRTATRPINMLDAAENVHTAAQADAVLNTPFCLIRTIGKNKGFRSYSFVNQDYIEKNIQPIKRYDRFQEKKPNIVLFILESFGREYWGSMNKENKILDYQGYTPFLDSLAQYGAVFTSAYANGRQSIHGMSSVLAGIPTFEVAYTSSPYLRQSVESIVSICNTEGYNTSFFHSAPNGSMGFLGFSNILGFQHYYGKNEYNNDADYDGIWGIWDEPFFQYLNREISVKKEPFFASIFTISSHHPFKIPKKYEGKFDEGTLEIHKCIQYTDNALRAFFQQAKKEKYFQNTIFVFTADHTNMTYYPPYNQGINNTAIPILFYSPNENLIKPTYSNDFAQQIDIYPSLVDLMGYNKPFRSWGRSLFSSKETPRAFPSNASFYQLAQGNYIFVLDQKGEARGVYKKEDTSLKINLLEKGKNEEISKGIQDMRAMMQDYMWRVMNKKLGKK